MAKRMTQMEFLARAKEVHGDTYDYSHVQYKNGTTKVEIVCATHGSFWQQPRQHLVGQGCPKCASIVRKATCKERYGTELVMNTKENREKAKQTVLERYGVSNVFAAPKIQEKIRQQNLERYGVENPSQNLDVYQKIWNTKLEHQTYLSGDSEEVLYEQLVAVFGADDVKRQYVSDVYPYPCDFYIVSRDLRIELNASWVHGGHWYDDTKDRAVLTEWVGKSADSKYYRDAVTMWAKRDVEKRACAKMNGLKYLVFWDTKLQDAQLWFDCGCPDATDWEREYSWLPKRTLSEHL